MEASVQFTSPVNPNTTVILSDGWVDATGFNGTNQFGPHPGNDLNKNTPVWNSDAGAPVYSIGAGVVTCSQRFKTWGWVIVIDHSTPERTLMSRYAHVLTDPGKVLVQAGDRVERGTMIAFIGNADGTQADHLHVDLTPTDILRRNPSYYPKTHADVLMYFIDMIQFLLKQTENPPMVLTVKKLKNVRGVVNVRRWPSVNSPAVAQTTKGQVVETAKELPEVDADGYTWACISLGGWTVVRQGAVNWYSPI